MLTDAYVRIGPFVVMPAEAFEEMRQQLDELTARSECNLRYLEELTRTVRDLAELFQLWKGRADG